MSAEFLYSACSVGLFGIGLYGLIASAMPIQKVLAVNIMGLGVFMLLIATAYKPHGITDPVPHAMVLTGIVVAVAGTALALSILCRIHRRSTLKDKDGSP
jgi:multicomponent Na+:H+ antiporter subunit C